MSRPSPSLAGLLLTLALLRAPRVATEITTEITTKTVAPAATGRCADPADLAAWDGAGRADFHQYMAACGRQCFGRAPCVAACVQGAQNFTAPCAACFGDVAACTASACLRACAAAAPTDPACAACVQSHCGAAFVDCTGFALPPAVTAALPVTTP